MKMIKETISRYLSFNGWHFSYVCNVMFQLSVIVGLRIPLVRMQTNFAFLYIKRLRFHKLNDYYQRILTDNVSSLQKSVFQFRSKFLTTALVS
jgi:hypothetical protein